MKIATQLVGGIGILVVLIVALGVHDVFHGNMMNESFNNVARMTRNRAMADSLVKDISRMRRDIWAGIATNNPERWKEAEELLVSISKQFEDLEKRVINVERRTALANMKIIFFEYQKLYPKIKAMSGRNIVSLSEDLKAALAEGTKAGGFLDNGAQNLAVSYQASSEQVTVEYDAMVNLFYKVAIFTCVITILFGTWVGFSMFRSIVPPLLDMTRAMGALAKGDLSIVIPATSKRNELGAMAKAVQVFKDNAIQVKALRRERDQAVVKAAAERKEILQKIAEQFKASIADVEKIVSSSATEMQTTARSISAVAQQASDKATKVAANNVAAANGFPELSAFIAEISGQVSEAARIASMASEKAARSNEIVQVLAKAAGKIGNMAVLINDISSQTDLLALSAAAEAEYAGYDSEGASMTNRIRSLANQTARATWEIGDQVRAVQDETGRAISAIRDVGNVIDDLRQLSSKIAVSMEKQKPAKNTVSRKT